MGLTGGVMNVGNGSSNILYVLEPGVGSGP